MAIARRITTPFQNIPDFFRRDIYAQIFESVEKFGNIQLVGLWGFGKSLTLRILESNQENIKKHLKINSNILVFLSDQSLLSDNATNLVLKHVFAKMLGLTRLQSLDGVDLTHELKKYFEDVRRERKKIILILDSLEKLESYHNMEVFDFLHALYKQNMDILSFVFCFEHEVISERARVGFGGLGRLMFNKVLYLTPLNSKEENWFFDSITEMVPGAIIPLKDKELILKSSGGYMVSIKRLIEAAVSEEDVITIIENPSNLPGLAYSLDLLLDGLGPDVDVLKKVFFGETDNNINTLELLQKCYLIDKNNKLLSRVLENYLKVKFGNKKSSYKEKIGDLNIDSQLTASEYKILEFLNKNKGNIVTRETIINEVWGNKADKGISDHALDQIISRLRKKLKSSSDNLQIETLRGRGHRLI